MLPDLDKMQNDFSISVPVSLLQLMRIFKAYILTCACLDHVVKDILLAQEECGAKNKAFVMF